MIKGQTYSNQLFENWAYRLTFDTLLNSNDGILEQYGNKMEVTATNNNIVVGSGLAVIQGGIIENTSDLTLVPQLQANEYYAVVVEIDMSQTNTTTNFNQGSIKLLSNSGGYPTLTKQDTIQGQGKYQYELARFTTTSSAIQNLTDTRTYLNYNSLYQELRDAIDQVIQDGIDAEQVAYDNTSTGLSGTNVQEVIDEMYNNGGTATKISYNNSNSGLSATNVQGAIDEVNAKINSNSIKISTQNISGNFNMGDSTYVLEVTPSIPSGYSYLTATITAFGGDNRDIPNVIGYLPNKNRVRVEVGSGQLGSTRNHTYTIKVYYIKLG